MKSIMVRFPTVDVKPRIKRLVELVARDADFRASRVSMSVIIKMALLEGIEALERRYGIKS